MKVLCFTFVLVAGCAVPASRSKPVASVAAPSSQNAASEVLATVDGTSLTLSDFDADLQKRLRDLDNETQQRRLHLLWVGAEQARDAHLLETAAQAEGATLESYRERHILKQIETPTDAAIQAFYDANRNYIEAPLKDVREQIIKRLMFEQESEAEEGVLAKLREQSVFTLSLPTPKLPRYPMEAGDSPAFGPKDAPVTLVEFSDFQCPYCARAQKVIEQLKVLYPDTLRVHHRDFPLGRHPQAQPAAEAAQCAHEQERFWDYHNRLFENPDALGDADLKRHAQELDLDMTAFEACLVSDRPKKAVQAHQRAGQRLGVEGTPAIFVNGIKLVGLLPLPLMQAIIDAELEQEGGLDS